MTVFAAYSQVKESDYDIPPSYIGGEDALVKYLSKTMHYPAEAQENAIAGTVYVSFIVNKDGRISDVKTVGARKGGGLEEEAIRLIKTCKLWKPAMKKGRPVKAIVNMPIRFCGMQE
jgi:protein TonB